jgi:nucleotide-binding universal stress UspA family protein
LSRRNDAGGARRADWTTAACNGETHRRPLTPARPRAQARARATDDPRGDALVKILLPVDGSPQSLEAVHQAIRLVREGLRCSFVLANVQEPSSLYEMVVMHDPQALRRMAVEAGEHLLVDGDALLTAADIEHEMEVASGEPAHTLIDLIENYGCDAVVMGATGMGNSSASLGSVAHELLRHAPVPVMIVRPPERPEAGEAAEPDVPLGPETRP